jgi:hypothetical protein
MSEDSVVANADRNDLARPKAGVAYIVAMVAGAAGSLSLLLAVLLVAQKTGHLPPPAISNNICIDEKLAFMRERPVRSPNLMVLGSSVAWRSVDGGVLSQVVNGAKPFNGAFCGLRMHQTELVGNWLLNRMPSVQTVAIVASPFDFIGCKVNPTRLFDQQAADDLVFANKWKWALYLRYFDPVSMIHNAFKVAQMRRGSSLDKLVFTESGDGPLDTSESKPTLVYGALPPSLDSECFGSLRQFAQLLAAEHRRLAVIATPVHPAWKANFDNDGKVFEAFGSEVRTALAGTGAVYWDGEAKSPMPTEAFTDAIHMRWSAVGEFTRTFGSALEPFLSPKNKAAGLASPAIHRRD